VGARRASGKPGLGRGKKALFSLATLLLFGVLIEGVLALLGVEPIREDPYAGFARRAPLFVGEVDEDGVEHLRTAPEKLRFFNAQRFPAEKPPQARRLFCLGGSTTYGRPFDDATSFCGWLRGLLAHDDAGADWQVVNAGGISYGSARVASLMRELSGYEPDVFVIYTGHNEFLERTTHARELAMPAVLREADTLLRRTRAYSSMRLLADRLAPSAASREVAALLDRSIGLDAYTRDDALRAETVEQFRHNLTRMIGIARGAGARPILVVPASNLASCSPFKSERSDAATDAWPDDWPQLLERARSLRARGRPGEARALLERAVDREPRHALAWYELGRALLDLGEVDTARDALLRARDEDVCPLRALTGIEEAVREIAAEQAVPLVDYPALLASRLEPSPFGERSFLDHVHPTVEAHGLLAEGIAGALFDRGLLAKLPDADDRAVVAREIAAGQDPEREGLALRNLAKVLSWAGKTADAARLAERGLSLLGEDAELEFILGTHAGESADLEAAVDHYRAAVTLEPDYVKAWTNLGVALARADRAGEAIEAYTRALELEPGHTNARYNLANALVREGRDDEAIEQYERVVAAEPGDADARFNLARALERRGEVDRAIGSYESVLEVDPGSDDARAALRDARRPATVD